MTTYYAALSGSDLISYRVTLSARTLIGAKREASRIMSGGFAHHRIVVGVLHDVGSHDERAEPLVSRSMIRSDWM